MIEKTIELGTFQGHVVLLCKNWYKLPKDVTFFEALGRIWAIRCGYGYDGISSQLEAHIATDMWKIINTCCPEKLHTYMDNFHREIANQAFYKPNNMSPIQAIIYEYRSILSGLQCKENIDGDLVKLVSLPKPMKSAFNRIIRGDGKYTDYKLIIGRDEELGRNW